MSDFPKSVLKQLSGCIVNVAPQGGVGFVGGSVDYGVISWIVQCRIPGSPTGGDKDIRHSVILTSRRESGKRIEKKWEVKRA